MLTVLYTVGIVAEAMTAALAAGRQRMDIFGVMLIASVTAFGGGVVRDLLLNHHPIRWVAEPIFLLIVLVAALITVLASFLMDYFRTIFLLLDAIGLSVFAVLGTQIALEMGHGVLIAIVAAVATGVFGGVLRDILCDRVPLVFHEDLYASVAVATALVYTGIVYAGGNQQTAVIVSLIVAIVLRVLAIYFKLRLPVFEYQDRDFARDPAGRLTLWMLNKAGVRRRGIKTRTITNDPSAKRKKNRESDSDHTPEGDGDSDTE